MLIRLIFLQIIFRNVNERNEWLEALNSAVEEQRSRKASFTKTQAEAQEAAVVACAETRAAPLGDTCPVWVPDSHVTMCQSCAVVFSLTCRRHHCRACGRVLCAACTDNRAPLRYNQFQAARVCDSCYSHLVMLCGHDADLAARFRPGASINKTPKKVSTTSRDSAQLMAGYLSLRTGGGRWRKGWYVLDRAAQLHCYAGREDVAPAASYDLARDYPAISGTCGLVTFILRGPGPDPGEGEAAAELHFTTDTHVARESWVRAILGLGSRGGDTEDILVEL